MGRTCLGYFMVGVEELFFVFGCVLIAAGLVVVIIIIIIILDIEQDGFSGMVIKWL